jgi:predicted nucleic acid-binding Zn ribbon protein
MEVVHAIQGHGPKTCPSCGSEGTMRKLISAPAIHFKGSGWAKKDRAATRVPGTSQAPTPTGEEKPEGASKPETAEGASKAGTTDKPSTTDKQAATDKPARAERPATGPAAD